LKEPEGCRVDAPVFNDFFEFCQIYSKYEKYAKLCQKYFGKIGHKIFCQKHQNYARFSKSVKNYAKLPTLRTASFWGKPHGTLIRAPCYW